MRIDGKTAVVSGAGAGIGRATALTLAARGATVVAVDINRVAARRTAADIEDAGGRALPVGCDVTAPDDVSEVLQLAIGTCGGLDILCNIAGIGGDNAWLTSEDSDWRRVIDVDLVAVIDATRQGISVMERGGGGVIVNMASLIALYPMAAAPIYSAAKAGVVAFTRSLAALADEDRIRVNAICPELVDTAMAKPMGEDVLAEARRAGAILAPERIADLVAGIVEDDARAGEIVQVTAGEGVQWVDLTPATR